MFGVFGRFLFSRLVHSSSLNQLTYLTVDFRRDKSNMYKKKYVYALVCINVRARLQFSIVNEIFRQFFSLHLLTWKQVDLLFFFFSSLEFVQWNLVNDISACLRVSHRPKNCVCIGIGSMQYERDVITQRK